MAARRRGKYADLAAAKRATPLAWRSRRAAAGGRWNPECAAAGLRAETYPGDAPILQIWIAVTRDG
jgi:hypothetical protein